jgi:pimeloyl-ACP methyl ester carboxylesterase
MRCVLSLSRHVACRPTAAGDVRLGYQLYNAPAAPSSDAPRPVVFIRGLGMTIDDSDAFARELARARGGPVVTFDHQGFGSSSMLHPGNTAFSIRDMALDTLAVVQDSTARLGNPGFHLFGVSMGGYIAMTSALMVGCSPSLQLGGLVVGCSHFGGPNHVAVDGEYIALSKRVAATPPDSPG